MSFSWIPFYVEFADKLLEFKNDRKGLIDIIYRIIDDINENYKRHFNFLEADISNIPDIDPFTVVSLFNRDMNHDNRSAICEQVKEKFKITAELPIDYDGIPTQNPQRTCFYVHVNHPKRDNSVFQTFWDLFECAINYEKGKSTEEEFIKLFDKGIKVSGVKSAKLSMALYHIRPNFYLSVDSVNESLIKSQFNYKTIKNGKQYLELMNNVKDHLKDFSVDSLPELTLKSYVDNQNKKKNESNSDQDWWPSLEEYDPGISKEMWLDYFNNCDKFYDTYKYLLGAMIDVGGQATCTMLAEKYGKTVSSYIMTAVHLAESVCAYFNIPLALDDDGRERFWKIPFLGRNAASSEKGSFVWKLREELREALEEYGIIDYFTLIRNDVIKDDNMITYDKNLILYGPPGTGKTYNSIIHAVAICDNKDIKELKAKSREGYYNEILPRYRELVKEGRITFTTFHQSYGYEDFIEGIKPYTDDSGNVCYRVENGVFKEFCESCSNKSVGFDEAWQRLMAKCDENDEHSYTFIRKDTKNSFKAIMYDENALRVYWNGKGDSYNSLTKKRIYQQWIDGDNNTYISKKSNGTTWANRARSAVIDTLISDFGLSSVEGETLVPFEKKRVFIIDEINRGNISKIFGELITLIEPTKRIGAKEEMKAVLPYSGDEFGVPENVYIIGTMNTADRSIALMDTALRRRFKFEEMLPEADLLKDKVVCGIDIKSLLKKINDRIELLYDREHTIGHSFFIQLSSEDDINALSNIFEKDIIPLLQEYFYDDYERISLVLGNKAFVDEIKINDSIFNNASFEVQKKYRINKDALNDPEEYKKIYEG